MNKFLGIPVFGWSNVANSDVLLSQKKHLFSYALRNFDSEIENAQWLNDELLWQINKIEVLGCGVFDLRIQIDRLNDYSIWITPKSEDIMKIKKLVDALEVKFAADPSFFIYNGENLSLIGSQKAFRPFAETYKIKLNPRANQ